jgi:hypothetical protein
MHIIVQSIDEDITCEMGVVRLPGMSITEPGSYILHNDTIDTTQAYLKRGKAPNSK